MAEKKKQHFVPQFYMRNWAVDPDRRRISLYAIGSGKHVAAATIKDQAYENYLYGKGVAEDVLSEMEGKAAPIIARAMKDNELPAPLTPDHAALLTFALLQDARTPPKAAGYDEQSLKVAQYLAREFPDLKDRADGMTYRDRETPLTALRIVAEMIPELQDLRMKLLVNRTPTPFITSDDPCVRYNQFMEKRNPEAGNTGLGNKGATDIPPFEPEAPVGAVRRRDLSGRGESAPRAPPGIDGRA